MIHLLKYLPQNPTLKYADSIILPPRTTEIVSEGGGSTIDVGKWIARKFNLKHTVIPTTAGTGSEVTKFCVLMVDGKKVTFEDKKFIPSNYVLNPQLLISLPRLQTISSGLDALSQCLESLWSKNRTEESEYYAKIGVNLILESFWECIDTPKNLEARMNMLIGANFSGRAINITKTNVCHAISYPLTELYDIPHGIACGLTLPYFAEKIFALNLKGYFKELYLPYYEIDIDNVADIVAKSNKLNDCIIKITKEDIIKSLSL